MKFRVLLLLSTLLLTVSVTFGQDIEVRVSVKVIVSPATGQVPASMNDALLHQSFADMNRWLANTWRGYRLRAVDLDANQNFKRIGSTDPTGPSKWYLTNLKDTPGEAVIFENEAKANKPLYGWNDSAVNLYFNNGGGFSFANYPWDGRDLVGSAYQLLLSDPDPGQTFSRSYKVAGNLLHEVGHYFGLWHTFDLNNDDELTDTALDPVVADARNETAVRNGIAQLNFAVNYSALTNSQKRLVDNTANNVMAYYQLFYDDPAQGKILTEEERFGPTRFLFTEQQLDKWADFANNFNNTTHGNTVSGRTRFVSLSGSDSNTGLVHDAPKRSVLSAVNSSNSGGGDIVLLRPGNYNEQLILNKPVTLRATRSGAVSIGAP